MNEGCNVVSDGRHAGYHSCLFNWRCSQEMIKGCRILDPVTTDTMQAQQISLVLLMHVCDLMGWWITPTQKSLPVECLCTFPH